LELGSKSMKQVCLTLFAVVLLLLGSQVVAQTEPRYWYVWLPDDSGTLVLTENAITLYDPAWLSVATRSVMSFDTLINLAPDGRTMLVRNGTWEIWDIRTLQTVRALPIDPRATGPVWSVDGSTITFRDAGQVGTSVYDSQTGAFIRSIAGQTWASALDMVWSTDRTKVAVNAFEYILLLDPNSGIEVNRIALPDPERMSIFGLTWSNDSQRIALRIGRRQGTQTQQSVFQYDLFILDVASGNLTSLVEGIPDYTLDLLWSNHDSELAAVTNNQIYIVDLNGVLVNRLALQSRAFARASYSQFGGQLRIGYSTMFDASSNQSSGTSQAGMSQFNDLIQVVVPVVTLDRFAEIATACGAPASLSAIDTSVQTQSSIVAESQVLVSRLEALPDTQIPPGCRADLLAIAAALQAQ
jgi:WD40 repeat protein